MTGHRDGVRSVSFNPDGSRVLSASVDQWVHVITSYSIHYTKLYEVLLEEALTTAGFSKDRIRKENFTSSISVASFEMPKAIVPNAKVTVEIEVV